MADGYLESHYAEYEQRKAAWLKKRKKTGLVPWLKNQRTSPYKQFYTK